MPSKTLVLLGILPFASFCAAQSVSSCIQGATADLESAPITDTVVTANETATGALYSTTTDSQGRFRLCGLTAGSYEVTAHHSGFADAVQEQSLPSGAALDLELVPSGSRKATALDTSSPGGPVTDLALLQPGSSGTVLNVSSDDVPVESFRVMTGSRDSQGLPNAPSTASRGGPHGAIYGLFGSNEAAGLTGSSLLPVSEFGGELTGSFDQNRTSYFVSYNQLAINRAQILSNLAARIGTAGTGLLADSNQLLSSSFAARADHRFSARDSAYLSYSRDKMTGNSLAAGRDAALPASAKGLNTSQQQLTVANTLNLSPDTVNQTSGQLFSTSVELPAGSQTPDVQAALPSRRVLYVIEAADNVYRQVGSQSLRLGGDFIASQMRLTLLENSMGRNPSMAQSSRDAGIYVEQGRQLRPNLSVTAGARYDAQFISGLYRDLNNFSPQVGIAWSPNSSRTVLRGGFGMDYDRIPLPTLAGSLDPDTPANLSRSVGLSNFGVAATGSLGNLITVPPTIQNAYAEHANFEAEQQLPGRMVLSSKYQFVRGVQLALPVYRTRLCALRPLRAIRGMPSPGSRLGPGLRRPITA